MNHEILHCNNGNCVEYKNKSCRRAVAHKKAVIQRLINVSYITPRNNKKACELHLPLVSRLEEFNLEDIRIKI